MLTDNILELTGNTPLLQLKGEEIFAKSRVSQPWRQYQHPGIEHKIKKWAEARRKGEK